MPIISLYTNNILAIRMLKEYSIRRQYIMGKDLKGKELGEGLRQRKDGIYSARFTNRFGKRVETYNRNLKNLKIEFNKAIYEDNMELNIIDNKITLDEWYEKWLTVHKYNIIRNSTKLIYQNIFIKYISPTLGNFPISEITHLQVKKLINDIDRKGLGFETKNKVRILLGDMFSKAIVDELMKKNPAKGIKIIRSDEEDSRKDIKVLSLEDQALFYECCKGTFYDNLFIVAVCTGLRCGELAALTENDIDFEKNEIRVSKTLLYQKLDEDIKKTFHLHPPKTKTSYRKVPMIEPCINALTKQLYQKNVIASKSPKTQPEGLEKLIVYNKIQYPY
jgi:integrase